MEPIQPPTRDYSFSKAHLAGYLFFAQTAACYCRPNRATFNFPLVDDCDYAVIEPESGEPVGIFATSQLVTTESLPHFRIYELRPMLYSVETYRQVM